MNKQLERIIFGRNRMQTLVYVDAFVAFLVTLALLRAVGAFWHRDFTLGFVMLGGATLLSLVTRNKLVLILFFFGIHNGECHQEFPYQPPN